MSNASIFTLILRGGITSVATGIVVLTPIIGLGCHPLGYLIDGGPAVVIFVFTIAPTFFARISETREEQSNVVGLFASFTAITLRRISLSLASINATGLTLLSCLQFSS